MCDTLSPTKRSRLRKLCIVGDRANNVDLFDTLKVKHDVDIVYSATGEEYVDNPEMVFFVSSFESPEYKQLHAYTSNSSDRKNLKIIGPAFIRSRLSSGKDIPTPKPNRPVYCECMKNAVVLLGEDIVDKRKFVDLLHYMGARVRDDKSPKINILLTKSASGELPKLTANIAAKILTPDYVHHCWKYKDNIHFDAMDPNVLARFSLGAFEGLTIAFVGFTDSAVQEMAAQVVKHKGRVVKSIADATHVVCNLHNQKEWKNEEASHFVHQWFVYDEWLWMSASAGRILGEKNYSLKSPATPEKLEKVRRSVGSPRKIPGSTDSRTSLLDFDHSTHSVLAEQGHSESLDHLKSPVLIDKKLMICQEMLETEQNYLSALYVLLKFQADIEKEADSEGLLPRVDSAVIFGKLRPVVACHEKLIEKMKIALAAKDVYEISKIWVDLAVDLRQAYVPYLNTYEIAKDTLEKALTDQRFYCFVKAKECCPEYKRNHLKELMIRPVQRLPSVILLLREIQKKSTKSDKTYKKLEEAVQVVSNILSKANSIRAVADEHMALYNKFNEVEDLPSDLMCHRRTFVTEVDGIIVGGSEKWAKLENKYVRLMAFNDLIVVVKIRSIETPATPTHGGMTLHRLARQASLSTLFRHPQKPYKFITYVTNFSIRYIRQLTQRVATMNDSEEGVVIGDPPVHCFHLRDSSNEEAFLLQPRENESMKKLLSHISFHLAMDYNREVEGVPFTTSELLATFPELQDCIAKLTKKTLNTTLTNQANYSTVHQPSAFRRALSNSGLMTTVAHRLRMTASKANLRNISENTPEFSDLSNGALSPNKPDDNSNTFTPRRGIRTRLTDTIFRRGSIRHPDFNKENSENSRPGTNV